MFHALRNDGKGDLLKDKFTLDVLAYIGFDNGSVGAIKRGWSREYAKLHESAEA